MLNDPKRVDTPQKKQATNQPTKLSIQHTFTQQIFH